jgi:hypothetical protein
MNYQIPKVAETKDQPVAQPQASVEAPVVEKANGMEPKGGLLLVVVGGSLHSSTLRYIEIALQRKRFSKISLVGLEEEAALLKQLKMDVYGVVGKLGREMGVEVHLGKARDGEGAIQEAVGDAIRGAESLQAVLCSISYGTGNSDILQTDHAAMRQSWESSFGSLHSVAKATVPLMATNTEIRPELCGFFALLEDTAQGAVAMIHQTACNTLLHQLHNSYASTSLTFGQASNVLVPQPAPIEVNGSIHSTEPVEAYDAGAAAFTPAESPTKLWNMWALQEEIAIID